MTLSEIVTQEILLNLVGLGFSIGYDNPKKALVFIMGIRIVAYSLTAIRLYQGA